MKKALLIMMCMAAMMAAGTGLKAQEVTIVLNPGWTWISCPSTDTLDFATAFGSFTPNVGDIIKSKWGAATYTSEGQWRGSLSPVFYPGYGYHYKSTRIEPVTVTFNEQQPDPQGSDHEYVDLGLPSGTLWATCNVGANNPEDYGDYFAWGETQPKDIYNWSTYQYCNGSSTTFTKYCNFSVFGYNGFTDNLTTLLPEDDAATANWSNGWRTPTKKEWQELISYCTSIWTTQNDVNGMRFTGPNGNSFFLPAAGHRGGSSLYYGPGYYLSSSLYTDDPSGVWLFNFGSDYCDIDGYSRYWGCSVRAVRSSSQNTSFIIDVTANPAVGGEAIGGGTYQEGAECVVMATSNEGYTFINWAENGEVVSIEASYSFTVTSNKVLVANFEVYHDYVDLGLPSGLLWATCNVGANSPEEYGDYFAWGETQPKDMYNWSTYQYCNGSSNTLTKYCNSSQYGYDGFTDTLTILLPEDDAATANWGGDWRMPTDEEWEELYLNTTHIWTTQNGVWGELFSASNGSSLFLPAAGYYNESDPHTGHGYYWSSWLSIFYPYNGRNFDFYGGNCNVLGGYRYYGQSVRPVRSALQN